MQIEKQAIKVEARSTSTADINEKANNLVIDISKVDTNVRANNSGTGTSTSRTGTNNRADNQSPCTKIAIKDRRANNTNISIV